ncbi:DUF3617 family protein [Sphingobium yanoikuyae]|jgi:hypothetical protein|uniref:DUF3617 family protein n=1 Tax=Sphingobium yanoikuyae TaxID=13690 RepID=UPI0004E2E44C|nr:DUF3617 family protein [Sphingobium yanoikuyae]KFD28879.1 hypothetical protein IH86_06605 [Sphingobium yanoikuyae]KZC81031.1 hypothetical protein AYR46_08960 [Sphingobium yanoikuyae]MDV3478856.1 DUF3617 family protein [Sphingobium yanoikuyae]
MAGRRWTRGLALALLGASGAALGTDTPQQAEDEIVVIAARMKIINIEYALRGPWLKACNLDGTTGTPAADRAICMLLQQCLLDGKTRREEAKQCVNARIDDLANHRGTLPALVSEAALEAAAAGQDAKADDAEKSDAIIVTGARHVINPGLWRFTEIGTYVSSMSGHHPPGTRQWEACIPDRRDDLAIRYAVEGPPRPAGTRMQRECHQWRITLSGRKFEGRLNCSRPNGGNSYGRMTGSVTGDTLEASAEHKTVGGRGLRGQGMQQPAFFATVKTELSGKRVAVCPSR